MSAVRIPGPDGRVELVPVDEGMTPFVHRSPFALYAVTLGDMAPRKFVRLGDKALPVAATDLDNGGVKPTEYRGPR